MSERRIGVALSGSHAAALLGQIERTEQAGMQAVWMTTGGARLDSITTFAAAPGRTNQIMFGTSSVPPFPRHPLVMAHQGEGVAQRAPRSSRLGGGARHR